MDQKYIMNKPEYKNFYFKQIKKVKSHGFVLLRDLFRPFFRCGKNGFPFSVPVVIRLRNSREHWFFSCSFSGSPDIAEYPHSQEYAASCFFSQTMPRWNTLFLLCCRTKSRIGGVNSHKKMLNWFFLGSILCVVLFFYSLLLGIVRTKKFFESSNCQSIMGGKQQQNCQARNGDYFLFSGINLSSLMDLRTDETDRYWLQEIKSRTLDRTWKCNICYVFNCTKLCFQMVLFVFFYACHLHLCKQIAWYR